MYNNNRDTFWRRLLVKICKIKLKNLITNTIQLLCYKQPEYTIQVEDNVEVLTAVHEYVASDKLAKQARDILISSSPKIFPWNKIQAGGIHLRNNTHNY